MIEPAHVSIGISMLAVFLVVAQVFIGRGDKSGGELAAVSRQVSALTNEVTAKFGDVNLQLANMRTDLATAEIRRAEDMRRTFVSREEYNEHRELVFFARDLTVETHKRMHPDASIHQPGGMHGRDR